VPPVGEGLEAHQQLSGSPPPSQASIIIEVNDIVRNNFPFVANSQPSSQNPLVNGPLT
jgi:hypothetical protein